MFAGKQMKNRMRQLIGILFMCISLSVFAQDSISGQHHVGFALNRYLPDREDVSRAHFFSLAYRYRWKTTEKYDHFATLRACGNLNNGIIEDPLTDKLYAGVELGYRGSRKRENIKWLLSWGVNIGAYHTRETVLFEDSENVETPTSFTVRREYTHLGISPNFGIAYQVDENTYIQLIASIGVSSPFFGDVSLIENNVWRGFSAQMPSLGIYRKF
jgi:hypothetical protein